MAVRETSQAMQARPSAAVARSIESRSITAPISPSIIGLFSRAAAQMAAIVVCAAATKGGGGGLAAAERQRQSTARKEAGGLLENLCQPPAP